MPRIVTLSSGEAVTFQEKFTHTAEKAYSSARAQGALDKEYVDEATGKLKIVRETPVVNYAEGIEAALLVMITNIKLGGVESTPTAAWLGGLDENDYDLLAEAMAEIRKAGREAGKKNRPGN